MTVQEESRTFVRAMRLDGSIESKLVVLGVAGGLLFLTLIATLFFVQRAFVHAQQRLVVTALPVAHALGRLDATLASAFERQAQVVSTRTLEQLAEVRDRSAIEAALGETEALLEMHMSTEATDRVVLALPEHGRAFLIADEQLLRSVEHRLRLRASFDTLLAQVDVDLANLIQSAKALSGALHFQHVVVLRRLAREMRTGLPSPDLVRSEVVGGVQGRMEDVADLVQGVIGLGRLAGKTGLALTDDALNSMVANEIAQNHSLIERLLAALARWSAPESDDARRIAALTEKFQALSPRISDESRQDSLIWLRRNILAEAEHTRQILRESARTVGELTRDLAVLERSSIQQTDVAVASSTLVTRWSQIGTTLVSLLGLLICLGAGVRIRNSVRSLAATNGELADLRDNLEVKVAKRTSQLSASREQYRLLVETTKTISFELEATTLCFLYIGPQAEELFGVARAACLAPGFLGQHVHPEDKDKAFAALAHALAQGVANLDIELRLRRSNGRYAWVRLIAAVAESKGIQEQADGVEPDPLLRTGMFLIGGAPGATSEKTLRGIILDVSQTHEMELQLRQAQKLESVGRLASGVAHEINTPVQFVNDNVHFLKDAFSDLTAVLEKHRLLRTAVVDGTASVQMAEDAARAEEEADIPYAIEAVPAALDRSIEGLGRISNIVRSMKEFAHPDQKEMAAVDLNQSLSSTLTIALNEYRYVADVDTDFGDLPPITCHAGEMNQVFLNIIVNAAHAIGDVVNGTDRRGRISVSSRLDGECVAVSIADTGGGIPDSIRDRIFDPFFTTKEVGRGTGQGLAIARSIVVDKHGGDLRVHSEMGTGTTFVIRFPIAGKPHPAAAAPPA